MFQHTRSDGSKVLYPGVHVQGELMIANCVQDGASTGDVGRVGEVQVSPMRAHVGSNQ